MLGNLIGVLFDGIAYGSLLFIISIGLSVTMGLMNFVNSPTARSPCSRAMRA